MKEAKIEPEVGAPRAAPRPARSTLERAEFAEVGHTIQRLGK